MRQIPLSAETERTVVLAGKEAGGLGQSPVGSEHLLLALLLRQVS